jgi:hypothetical protein
LLLLFCDSSGSKDTHCRHISKFAGEIITGAILTGAIITDTIDRNRHCITNTIDRNEYSHLILALRRTSGKNKRAGYMQGEFIYHNMSNSAVNANGILKDASEIEWFHDPDDDMPISPHPESSSKALPPGPRTLDCEQCHSCQTFRYYHHAPCHQAPACLCNQLFYNWGQ